MSIEQLPVDYTEDLDSQRDQKDRDTVTKGISSHTVQKAGDDITGQHLIDHKVRDILLSFSSDDMELFNQHAGSQKNKYGKL